MTLPPRGSAPAPASREGAGEGGFARRSIRGAAWLFGTGYIGFVVNFLVNLLIARLVDPTEFGTFALALATMELVGILSTFSVPLALIHLGDDEPHLFDTGGWMMLATGFINLVAASGTALFLRSSEAGSILVTMALSRVLLLYSLVSSASLEKTFRYDRVARIGLVATAAPNFLALALAWVGCGAWSLAGREVATGILSWGLYGLAAPWRFRGHFSPATARKIWSFSARMFLSRGLQVVLERADRLMVGWFSGTAALGLYDRARYIAEVGMTLVRPADGLSFNLYSRLREERERLSQAYAALNFFVVRGMAALVLVLALCPADVVWLLLGPAWVSTAPALRWMALYGGLVPVVNGMFQLLYGRGLMRESNRIKALQAAVFLPAFLAWLVLAGLPSASCVLFLAAFVAAAALFRLQRDLLAPTFREVYLAPAGAVLAAGAAMAPLAMSRAAPSGALGALAMPLGATALYGAILLGLERRRLIDRVRFVSANLLG